jgi:hypothetical protein
VEECVTLSFLTRHASHWACQLLGPTQNLEYTELTARLASCRDDVLIAATYPIVRLWYSKLPGGTLDPQRLIAS